MRYQSSHAEVQAEGFAQSVSGSIAASGKAFKGLIDGLYSRKIEAIVRELATNAFDGQKAASYIGPFAVHLPSALDPVFWIRDHGTGMSHQHMMTRYPVLFDSTKDGLNPADAGTNPDDQVGCLGLGSKSFFAYTDACTLTIWQAGEMRVYSVYMGGDGIIQIAHAGSMPSDEGDGVKVEFAVKTKDFAAFREAAVRVFKGFPIQPEGLPTDVVQQIATEPSMIGAFWKSYPKDYLPGGGFYARQGCVLYPIDLSQVDGKATEDEDGNVVLSTDFTRYADNKNTVVIDFPIGSIAFDLSRERLAYDDRTVTALRKRWTEFTDDLHARFRASFMSLTNGFERMKVAFSGPAKEFGCLFGLTKESFEAEAVRSAIYQQFPKNGSTAAEGRHAILHIVGKNSWSPLAQTPPHTRHQQAFRSPNERDVPNFGFIFRDVTKPHEKIKIGLWMQEQGHEYAVVIRPGKLTLKLWREWGCPPITRISALPNIPKVPTPSSGGGGHGGGSFDRFKIIDDERHAYADMTSDAASLDMDDRYFALINKGLFVSTDRRTDDAAIEDVMLLHRLVKRMHGIDITLINTRINEPDDKWDAFPKFYDLIDTFVEQMPATYIKRFIAVLNRSRFVASWYCGVLASWRAANPASDDPIAALGRFEKRYGSMPSRDRALFLNVCSRAGLDTYHTYHPTAFWRRLADQMIDRARLEGLEVLMPMGPHRTHLSENISHRLLPKRWERVARHVNNFHQRKDKFQRLLLKDALSC